MKMRGAFVVIEGCDRSGKSSQCRLLVDNLNKNNIKAKLIVFPDRSTAIGNIINSYLKKEIDLPDQAIHLLFAANRWEQMEKMKSELGDGTTLIVDRYSYSGVAYSASKTTHGMDPEWFKGPEVGLLKPDVAFYLHLNQDVINQRKGFGDERYETSDFQKRVSDYFETFHKHEEWQVIDANKTIEQLGDELLSLVETLVNDVQTKPLSTLW